MASYAKTMKFSFTGVKTYYLTITILLTIVPINFIFNPLPAFELTEVINRPAMICAD
jgi:hypothetical protein